MEQKLYEIPKGSKIKLPTSRAEEEIITFHHIDGAYSYCTAEDGEVLHLSVSTPLIKDGEFYRISKTLDTDEV